jgi:hypothetical protein
MAHGSERDPAKPLWRFELDNDVLLGSDDAFSSGWEIERHSAASETWEETGHSSFSLFVAEHVPGLGDDGEGGRVVRRGIGLSQLLQTPADITDPGPQPEDVPWAAALGVHVSWLSVDSRRLNAFQIYLGCMGPCAGGEPLQRFVHDDLGLSTDIPEGWDHQLDTEPLVNLNYAVRRKLLTPSPESYGEAGFSGDLGVGAQAGVGNFFRVADLHLELRFGWRLPTGFTQIPDPPGRGVMVDASPRDTEPDWAFHVSVIPRLIYFEHVSMLDGGATSSGGYHPGVDYERSPFQVLYGLHLSRAPFSFHLTYYSYYGEVLSTPTGTSLDWVNLSFEYRF